MPAKPRTDTNLLLNLARQAVGLMDQFQDRQHLGDPDLNEKTAKFIKPLDQMGQALKADPLRTATEMMNPLAAYEAAGQAVGTAVKEPNLENILMALGAGMNAGQTGMVKYTIDPFMGVPKVVDPVTGLFVGPSSRAYFGRTGGAQIENIGKLSELLRSNAIDMEDIATGVMSDFGLDVSGNRGMLLSGTDKPTQLQLNIEKALERIPTPRPNQPVVTTPLAQTTLGNFEPISRVVRLNQNASKMLHGTLPHELQHAADFENNIDLFGMPTRKWMSSPSTYAPTDNMASFIAETRADMASKRFNRWLEDQGIMHWWDEPGSWPR